MIESQKRPKIVGNFIRQKREALSLSQRALGLLFAPPVTTQFISNVERGVTPLPPAHVPTLTRALQVSEAELMGLLEKEYTHKLSGRLGLQQSADGQDRAGAVIIPMNAPNAAHLTNAAHTQAHLAVSAHDFEFIKKLYEAYSLADPKTRLTFAGLCQTMFNMRSQPNPASVGVAAQTAASGNAVMSGGDGAQG